MPERQRRIAGAGTLLGKLQRGRGAGFLEALAAPREDVWAMLRECIENDSRWSVWFEERSGYYATLAMKVGMDVGWVEDFIKTSQQDEPKDWDRSHFALLFVESMAWYGNERALAIVRRYMHYGKHWEYCLNLLHWRGGEQALHEGMAAVLSRIADDEEIAHLIMSDDETVESLGRMEGRMEKVVAIMEELGQRNHRDPWAEYRGKPIEELFAIAGEKTCVAISTVVVEQAVESDTAFLAHMAAEGNEWQQTMALRTLVSMGTHQTWDVVENYVDSHPDMTGKTARRIITHLEKVPAVVCLQTGRRWFKSEIWIAHLIGADILELHAEASDMPAVVERMMQKLADGEQCLCRYLRILQRFGGYGRITEIERAFEETQESSYCRTEAAETMVKMDPEGFRERYAAECLWDCEEDTRKIGCEMVDIERPGVKERLDEIANDQNEGDELREAAGKRLAGKM
jgi:hypothetical protein